MAEAPAGARRGQRLTRRLPDALDHAQRPVNAPLPAFEHVIADCAARPQRLDRTGIARSSSAPSRPTKAATSAPGAQCFEGLGPLRPFAHRSPPARPHGTPACYDRRHHGPIPPPPNARTALRRQRARPAATASLVDGTGDGGPGKIRPARTVPYPPTKTRRFLIREAHNGFSNVSGKARHCRLSPRPLG
jgi:hypothetical protein